MSDKSVRIGIDVGGTFTHAVAVDHNKLQILCKACTPTTHSAPEGVARGIWQCLEMLLAKNLFTADEVVFVAHSTTQATNALLEGDVAAVGLIGIVEGASGVQARRDLSFGDVKLSGDHVVPVTTYFIKPDEIAARVPQIANAGQDTPPAFVIAEAFAVDNPERERAAADALIAAGRAATGTHEVSGLYGLKSRARTSVINAAILPKMVDVAEKTASVVDRLSIRSELMIMRSDGGVMSATLMKKTPILTILSGPAAGVSAAILYEKIANGLFVEVGGTSTDISLILNGKPLRKQAVIGGNQLYLKTLDVRTTGAAGGSMVRMSGGKVIDAGPRSAHIAGLDYVCFTDRARWSGGASIKFISPLRGDPSDYAVLESSSGERFAITTTCAANYLGLVAEGGYSRGRADSVEDAFGLLAAAASTPPRKIAEQIIAAAASKVEKLCRDLITEYDVSPAGISIVGGGGGAGVVAAATAARMNLPYKTAADAEVVSAVGVAMALMKEVVEKSIIDPSDGDIRRIRAEAMDALASTGADRDSIEVDIEVDRHRNILRATATGAASLVADRRQDKITPGDALAIARKNAGVDSDVPFAEVFADGSCHVLRATMEKKGFLGFGKKVKHPLVVVDAYGLARLTLQDADAVVSSRENLADTFRRTIAQYVIFGDGGAVAPAAYVAYGGKVLDLSQLGSPEKMAAMLDTEIAEHPGAADFCIIVKK